MIYLFSILALVLLLPILYFIPIGISVKGKIMIASVAFGLTLLGLVASSQYPIWMIGIMLLVLLGISSYMIEQRFSGLLALATGTEVEEKQAVYTYEEPKKTLQSETDENVGAPETWENDRGIPVSIEEETETLELDETDEILIVNTEIDLKESSEQDELDTDMDEVSMEDDSKAEEAESFHLVEDESEWFIENASENELNEEIENVEEKRVAVDNGLSEIESMINGSDEKAEDRNEEKEAIQEVFDAKIDKNEDAEKIESLPDFEEELEEPEYKGPNGIEGELDHHDAKEEDMQSPLEDMLENVDHDHREVEDLHMNELPQRTRIMREVMKTMIEQIALSQSLYSSDQMENMIKHYLHPSLHDQDYYTFARILMDHYISTEQFEDLQMFIKVIEERFKDYPYIQMDLEQTNDYASEKQSEIKTIE
ncbi:hypothetical protein FGG79_10920 [Bacillus sp. BHET2]|uniref:hypothetical protein n=1 Tax=Bacillus sp. BHET2 TaxID=2583818 RepID=UPI00110D486E|nr:hypothetical protein [Bacillus sp. BHET2]TMU85712.1 hypothetical protein FGG79_10920 [Bacillus sp. BHET2]